MSLLKKKQITSSAEVVDNHLILSLPNAMEPVVWRMALDKIGTASFEIKPTKNKDAYQLVLTPKKGTMETIAPFEDKENAMTALMQASNAMQRPSKAKDNSQQQIHVTSAGLSAQQNQPSRKWIYLLLGFITVIGLYILMVKQVPKTINSAGNQSTSISSGTSQTGVPQSADDFLNGL
jgi:hypothetical protein